MDAWKPQHVVSKKLATTLIEEQFPVLKPIEIRELGKGFDNTVFQVNGQYVFRFPRKEIAVELLEKEKNLLPVIENKLSLPIPKPIMVGEADHGYPWFFLGYDNVPGAPPGLLSDDQRDQSAEAIAEFLKDLHSFPVDEAKRLGVSEDELQRPNISLRKPQLVENLEKAYMQDLLSRDERLGSFIQSLKPISFKPSICLVHGDFHIRNILVDVENRISGVIDWGDSVIGHPSVDLSFIYSFFSEQGREHFYDIYGQVDEETKTLAKFISIYISVVLLLYGHEFDDKTLVQLARGSIDNALLGVD
ncbi:phosphotransferase [Pontibacillus sp. HMF3514]|uniref:phosphotransferase n=1 Tax=Pontibacillus sp. HMF3514 TaxID=2692425 RepID=UPI00131FF369|nr:phosphotransferase [Pontibacillus sp. HMF3514]QHE54005.1 phosphotransferase [Pontibacillus sp. HMF3514]